MIRRLVALFLAALMSLPYSGPAWSAQRATPAVMPYHVQAFFDSASYLSVDRGYFNFDSKTVSKKVRQGVKLSASAGSHFVGHSGQTFILLWILAGIEALHQMQKMNPIEKASLATSEVFAQAGDLLANSPEFYGSLTGGLAANVGRRSVMLPYDVLKKFVGGTTTKTMLSRLLSIGAVSFITFVGWEAGKYLWRSAIYAQDEVTDTYSSDLFVSLTPDEIQIALNLRFLDVLKGKASTQEQTVFRKVMHNAYQILTYADESQTKSWLFNTWRLGIATGEFTTMITAMVGAGIASGMVASYVVSAMLGGGAGGSAVPGLGTAVGIFFGFVGGLAGGIAVVYLPASYKRPITDAIRKVRRSNALNDLAFNTEGFKIMKVMASMESNQTKKDSVLKTYAKHLKDRQRIRENLTTALIEQVYDGYILMQEADHVLGLIKDKREAEWVRYNGTMATGTIATIELTMERVSVKELEAEFKKQSKEGRERVNYYMNELSTFLVAESDRLEKIRMGLSKSEGDLESGLLKAISNQEILITSMALLWAGLMPEKMAEFAIELNPEQASKLGPGSLTILNAFQSDSFREDYFLKKN